MCSKQGLAAWIICGASVFMLTSVTPVVAGCFDCTPQCVEFARNKSGINVHGNAIDWIQKAGTKGYKVTDKPKNGAVIVLAPNQHGVPSVGHLIFIEDCDKKGDGKYSLRLSHSNYDCKCNKEERIKGTYYRDKRELKIKEGAWAGKSFAVAGIVKK